MHNVSRLRGGEIEGGSAQPLNAKRVNCHVTRARRFQPFNNVKPLKGRASSHRLESVLLFEREERDAKVRRHAVVLFHHQLPIRCG